MLDLFYIHAYVYTYYASMRIVTTTYILGHKYTMQWFITKTGITHYDDK